MLTYFHRFSFWSNYLPRINCLLFRPHRFHPSRVDRVRHGIFPFMSIQVPKIINIMPAHCCIYSVHVTNTNYSQCHGNSAPSLFGTFGDINQFVNNNNQSLWREQPPQLIIIIILTMHLSPSLFLLFYLVYKR